jgi:hypothetical protein
LEYPTCRSSIVADDFADADEGLLLEMMEGDLVATERGSRLTVAGVLSRSADGIGDAETDLPDAALGVEGVFEGAAAAAVFAAECETEVE